jgi:LysM repeat protein
MSTPRHARRRARKSLRPVIITGGGAAGVMALGWGYIILAGGSTPAAVGAQLGTGTQDVIQAPAALASAPAAASLPAAATLAAVTVKPGDTLSQLAAQVCGTAADALPLAYNNHLASPDKLRPGQVLRVRCTAPAAAVEAAYPPPKARPPAPAAVTAARSSSGGGFVAHPDGSFSCPALEQLWDQAGGNPADAVTAASVAMAESGGNPNAVSPTDDFGLWQINGSNGALATLSPAGSAHSAVVLSRDGTDWGAWTTFTDGASAGRC